VGACEKSRVLGKTLRDYTRSYPEPGGNWLLSGTEKIGLYNLLNSPKSSFSYLVVWQGGQERRELRDKRHNHGEVSSMCCGESAAVRQSASAQEKEPAMCVSAYERGSTWDKCKYDRETRSARDECMCEREDIGIRWL
jgi:hypothetical protein